MGSRCERGVCLVDRDFYFYFFCVEVGEFEEAIRTPSKLRDLEIYAGSPEKIEAFFAFSQGLAIRMLQDYCRP